MSYENYLAAAWPLESARQSAIASAYRQFRLDNNQAALEGTIRLAECEFYRSIITAGLQNNVANHSAELALRDFCRQLPPTTVAVAPPPPPPNTPQSIVTAGLQSVWALRTSGTGRRGATNKTLGVDALPAGATYSSGVLFITSSCTFGDASGTGDRWDFSPGLSVVVRGNSTVVIFWDCLFKPQSNNPAVNNTQFYGLWVPDDATTHPTVTVNYCTFDGGKYNSNVGVQGPWNGAALYTLLGSNVTVDHCKFTGCGYDVFKVTNATLTVTNTLVQAYGWNINSDADGIQQISGSINLNNCIFDISDGDHPFPGEPPNSALFCTIDTPSNGNGSVSVQNIIFYGYGQYQQPGPFNVVSVADNHTATGNGFHIVGGVWNNLVIEPGSQHSGTNQFGYWTHGGTETSAVSILTWANVIDFNTGAAVTPPSF